QIRDQDLALATAGDDRHPSGVTPAILAQLFADRQDLHQVARAGDIAHDNHPPTKFIKVAVLTLGPVELVPAPPPAVPRRPRPRPRLRHVPPPGLPPRTSAPGRARRRNARGPAGRFRLFLAIGLRQPYSAFVVDVRLARAAARALSSGQKPSPTA